MSMIVSTTSVPKVLEIQQMPGSSSLAPDMGSAGVFDSLSIC